MPPHDGKNKDSTTSSNCVFNLNTNQKNSPIPTTSFSPKWQPKLWRIHIMHNKPSHIEMRTYFFIIQDSVFFIHFPFIYTSAFATFSLFHNIYKRSASRVWKGNLIIHILKYLYSMSIDSFNEHLPWIFLWLKWSNPSLTYSFRNTFKPLQTLSPHQNSMQSTNAHFSIENIKNYNIYNFE